MLFKLSPSTLEQKPRSIGKVAKRLLLALGVGFAALVVGAAAFAPWLYSPAALRHRVAAQLEETTGLYAVPKGDARFALLPRPHIALTNVALGDHAGALHIDAGELVGALNVTALALGRLEISAIQLVRPRASLIRASIDAPGAGARARAARPATQEAIAADRFLLGVGSVVDGELRVSSNGREWTLEKINATLDWRRVGEPFALAGDFVFRGEKLNGLFWIARPGALLRGERGVVSARLDGENLKFEAQGEAQLDANPRFAGQIAGSAASFRHAAELLDMTLTLPSALVDARIAARAVIARREGRLDAQLADMRIAADGNEFEGSAQLSHEHGRATLSASLKSPFVSFRSIFADAPIFVAADGQWRQEPFALPDFAAANIDLRLEAQHARLGRVAIDNALFTLSSRDRIFDIGVKDARAYGGGINLHAVISLVETGLKLHLDAATAGVDAAGFLGDAVGWRGLGGAFDSTVAIDAAGPDMMRLMRSATGHADLALKQGEIAGLDLERALDRLEQRPLASARDIRSGRSNLVKASATAKIENGVAEAKDGAAFGPGYALSFTGRADLPERHLALRSIVAKTMAEGPPIGGARIAFDVAGPWDDLRFTTDAQDFIRRSGAAAPLLPSAETKPEKSAPPP